MNDNIYDVCICVCDWVSEYDFAEVNSRGFIMREAEGCSFYLCSFIYLVVLSRHSASEAAPFPQRPFFYMKVILLIHIIFCGYFYRNRSSLKDISVYLLPQLSSHVWQDLNVIQLIVYDLIGHFSEIHRHKIYFQRLSKVL